MTDQKKSQSDDATRRANTEQSSGSNAAGTGENPQDARDSGQASEARPRGKTDDPNRTL